MIDLSNKAEWFPQAYFFLFAQSSFIEYKTHNFFTLGKKLSTYYFKLENLNLYTIESIKLYIDIHCKIDNDELTSIVQLS